MPIDNELLEILCCPETQQINQLIVARRILDYPSAMLR